MMNKLTNKDTALLAQASRLSVSFDAQIDVILGYSESIMSNASMTTFANVPQVLIMRPDKCIISDSPKIISQAPVSDDNYFVVPVVVAQ